jgi:Ca2+-binding EF-hand superfamily protein
MYDKEKKGEISTSLLGIVMKNLGHNLKPDQLADCIDAVDGDGMFIRSFSFIFF